MDGLRHHPVPEQDPDEKAYADVVEETIIVATSIEEEFLLEAAEIQEITFRASQADG